MTIEQNPSEKQREKEWEAIVKALLASANNALTRLSLFAMTPVRRGEIETEMAALLRASRTLTIFLEESGRRFREC